jgi:transposase
MNDLTQKYTCWGVDVASGHLDIAAHGIQAVKRIANTPAAIKQWLRSMPAGSKVGLESTGIYHLELARLAHQHGLVVYVLNPRDIKKYSQGLGQRGKTDRLDAKVIARFVQHEHGELRPWQPLTEQQQWLDELLRERALVQKQRAGLKQSMAHRPMLKDVMAPLLQVQTATLDRLEKMICQAACELTGGKVAFRSLISIPGVGVLTASALLRLFDRAKGASADAIVALIGLDPRPMESGNRKGIRRLSKRGDSETRRLLYNAGMAGAKTDTWRPVFERERAKGLPATAALMVLARRLVRIAYSLFKSGGTFDRQRVAL